MKTKKIIVAAFICLVCTVSAIAQISPGELSKVHAHLEGMSNCTQCHTLGAKVSNSKCLACHTEINERITAQKGYHASPVVKGKECSSCHNDHHGKNFQIVRFDLSKFSHTTTGYKLEGAHSTKKCEECHKPAFISNPKLKTRSNTYLGLKTECLSCHPDYHQKALSPNCLNCHNKESFKTVTKFNHSSTKFPLVGKHTEVECSKCHPIEIREDKKFQKFTGIQFNNCTNCHTDVHQNKYGQNCKQCHTENSFHIIKNTSSFDHSKTGFPLEGKHSGVGCISCHKTNYSTRLKHDKCTDCHADYHKSQFVRAGVSPDCSKCHTINGFSPSSFTLEQHNQCEFKLKGSHVAVPCFECHKKEEKWNFRKIGAQCVDCHPDIHQPNISTQYYPNKTCTKCHTEKKWSEISFDHSQTKFKLAGKHATISCRACHFVKDTQGKEHQKFAGTQVNCVSCHKDNHNRQFEKNGITDCTECHISASWKVSKFDHNNTAFKLDGKHQNVACAKCHIAGTEEKYIVYKIKNFKCESCHLQ